MVFTKYKKSKRECSQKCIDFVFGIVIKDVVYYTKYNFKQI